MNRYFVDLKIDTERHTNGAEVAAKLRGGRSVGIPWMVMTDASGAELVTSDGPKGNIGCPVTEDERSWFVEMVRRSAPEIDAKEIATLAAELAAYAKSMGR